LYLSGLLQPFRPGDHPGFFRASRILNVSPDRSGHSFLAFGIALRRCHQGIRNENPDGSKKTVKTKKLFAGAENPFAEFFTHRCKKG